MRCVVISGYGDLAERNSLHNQKVVGSSPTSATVYPLARRFIPSCSTHLSVIIGSCYRGNHDLSCVAVPAHQLRTR